PVRTLVNTHFHWDHTQGNRAYLSRNHGDKVEIIASTATKQLMDQLLVPRLQAALDLSSPGPRGSQQVARQLQDLKRHVESATSEAQKSPFLERIAQLQSFAAEMKDFGPALPTMTFENSYVIREKGYDLHLQFHGCGHTAGDIVVFCPQKRIVVTGDAHHSGFPGFIDSYPQLWPKQVDSILNLQFDQVLPGHGRAEHDRRAMIGRRHFIQELTERVIAGKKAGQSAPDLQRSITAASLKSLRAQAFLPDANPDTIESGVKNCIDNMYDRVEKVSFTGTEPIRLRG
ncbi:MAG TPA: MBL fold metallo-hydrolase, partial [Candidatus Sulfotelmatobacter sp.]|nr:MBL fold metallo-hydrolase [Candidatus Sulfotelmatobacter sp.]